MAVLGFPKALPVVDKRHTPDHTDRMSNPSVPRLFAGAQQFGPHASFVRFLVATGLMLAVLMAWLEPSASAGLGFATRFMFWLLHVAAGLLVMACTSLWIVQLSPRLRSHPWSATLLTGIVGSALFTPVAMGLEAIFPEQDPDQVVTSGWWIDALLEYGELVVPLTVCWALLNGPKLLRVNVPELGASGATRDAASPASETAQPLTRIAPETPGQPAGSADEFIQLLPAALGTDIIAVSSDLHYLHVYTPRGQTMVLHNLRDAVVALGVAGEQVHRSHWVAHAHVARLSKRSRELHCVMSNGIKVPVSRRRQKSIIDRFGRDTRLKAGATHDTRPVSRSPAGERSI